MLSLIFSTTQKFTISHFIVYQYRILSSIQTENFREFLFSRKKNSSNGGSEKKNWSQDKKR